MVTIHKFERTSWRLHGILTDGGKPSSTGDQPVKRLHEFEEVQVAFSKMWNLSVDMEAAPRESRMQNKESDIGVRRASNKKRHQNLQSIMQIPEHFTELSIRMFDALDDSGAGKETVLERRRTFLRREHIEKISYQLEGMNSECFHFGSQSEGTTTPGLQSDIDFLQSNHIINIMTVWEDWRTGMINLLMLHDNTTPPQQYLLQLIHTDTPEPETSLTDDTFVRKDSGQILFSAERWKQEIEYVNRDQGEVTKNGPSVSFTPNWDIVNACHIRKPFPEIQHWIDRCRGKHWPPVQLLEAARIAPCFLVPAGHPDSDYKREEWRLSPNLIERMLIGHLQAAVRVLEDVERRYHSTVKAVCGCGSIQGDRDLKVFADMLLGNTDNSELPFTFCVNFLRQESHCAPLILLFEMNRNITEEEVAQRDYTEKHWMGSAEVDALPFLYYMQYITYGGLGERDTQLHAMGVLEAYNIDIRNQLNLYHQETALNLLGHCYEMEGDYAGALHYYEWSLRCLRTNNAANWHVLRIMRLISG
ncbi:uncharacterized protein LOC127849920 [Dreissena polymorpha]|uniref:uncharacterized protein LOC127849920 n=1 Tax=Dreissena polymorpha TaxID=45954 RepID=UPI00226539A7|nr:uncharacterized protein LOC127849920 [Dreissena polymorpha]